MKEDTKLEQIRTLRQKLKDLQKEKDELLMLTPYQLLQAKKDECYKSLQKEIERLKRQNQKLLTQIGCPTRPPRPPRQTRQTLSDKSARLITDLA